MANIEQQNQTDNPKDSIGQFSIDSLKLKIPLCEVKITNPTLTDKFALTNMTTGEAPDEAQWKQQAQQGSRTKGISTYYSINDLLSHFGAQQKYLVILVNSKLLTESYLQGISTSSLRKVYDAIIKQGMAIFSYNDFLKATVTDVDFKVDQVDHTMNGSPEDFDAFTLWLTKRARHSPLSDNGYRRKHESYNKGIQFSKRETTSYKSSPFLKFYHKELELNYHSETFSSQFLNPAEYKNRIRVEVTIKNKDHFRHYGIEDTSLGNIASLDQDTIKSFFIKAYKKHFEMKQNRTNNPDKLLPMETILCEALSVIMEDRGLTFQEAKEHYLFNIPAKQTRYRINKQMDRVYEIGIRGSHVDKEAKKFEDLCAKIGLL